MDYGFYERRRTKGDKKAKRRFRVYKRGGAYRSANVKAGEKVNKGY